MRSPNSHKVKRRGKLPIIGDMTFSLLTMPAAFSYLDNWTNDPENVYLPFWIFATYVTMGIAQLFRAFRLRKRSRVDFISHLVYGCVFLVCAALLLIIDYTDEIRITLGLAYWAVLLAGRILSIVRKHSLRNILLNIVAIFLIASYAMSVLVPGQDFSFVVMVAAGFGSLFSIMAVAFSRMKLDVLKDIIRQTYAAEIIVGLLLLIFACSWVLRFTDEGFSGYGDALWYCFAVVTTIGFGDFAATTFLGRLITVVLGIYGIIVVALITSVIVNYYGEMKKTVEEPQPPEEPQASELPPPEEKETGLSQNTEAETMRP